MRRTEMKICRECKNVYLGKCDGIVRAPRDYMDMGLCEKCKAKLKLKTLGMIVGGGRKK